MAYSLPQAKVLFSDAESSRELSERREELVAEMTKATISGLSGETTWGPKDSNMMDAPIGSVVNKPSRNTRVAKAIDDYQMAKSTDGGPVAWDNMSKEWTLKWGLGLAIA